VEVHTADEVEQAVAWAEKRRLPIIMIGDGSNIVWRDEGFAGLVIVNRVMGFSIQEESDGYYVTIGAGENWDSVVARTVEQGLTGIETLSLIPGTAGATPIQNVGAYGQEIAHSLVDVAAYDKQTKQHVTIPWNECEFNYRSSRFKTTDRGRFFITGITLRLTRNNPEPPFYAGLQQHLEEHGIHQLTPQSIRDAVIAIRQSKLPDPATVANNGSFFANPIISPEQFASIATAHPKAPHWPLDDGRIKLPAAWLLEQTGFKHVSDPETGMATWPAQPLVLVNESAKSTEQLLQFKQKIVDAVHEQFGITLEQEPELLPS
jgi:UDP-N-acetylmuramate dehydrogenase